MSHVSVRSARAAGVVSVFALLAACAAAPTPEPPAPETPPPASGGDAPTPAPSPAPPAAPPLALDFASSGHPGMDAWRDDFAQRAIASGRAASAVTAILSNLSPMPIYLDPDVNIARTGITDQAEFAKPIWEYLETAVSDIRKETGAERLRATPARLEARYGVDREVLAAIWGMETKFGGFIGNDDAANALANMAVEGRRRSFAEAELTALMKLIEMGVVERRDLISGWAGAMGQTQFMPTTFLAHAEDFEGDGRKDVWNNPADALASAANYLATSGYEPGKPWGIEVRVPTGFDYALANGTDRPVSFWIDAGLQPAGPRDFTSVLSDSAELWLPAGADGPKYLLFDNFDAFKTYNRADSYALAVGLLADGVAGGRWPIEPWPTEIEPLSVAEIKELQAGLNALGYNAGPVDGVAGRGTRGALQRYQNARGMLADGYPTKIMLAYVLGDAGG